jgi:hypothetical protein
VIVFAKLRGFFDSVSIAFRLLFSGGGFARSYIEQIETISATQYCAWTTSSCRTVGSFRSLRRRP